MSAFFASDEWQVLLDNLPNLPFATWESFYATVFSTLLALAVGLPVGVLLVAGEKDGVRPLPSWLMTLLNLVINLLRSVPFLILMIMVLPLSRLVLGTSIGTVASIIPLFMASFPFVSRLVETSLREVDGGVVEAAQSMGATPLQIILKVMIPESLPSLIANVTIALTTILGYSAMAGIIGGGGLGQIAINYGYYRYKYLIMVVATALLVIMVQVFQTLGTWLAAQCDKRLRAVTCAKAKNKKRKQAPPFCVYRRAGPAVYGVIAGCRLSKSRSGLRKVPGAPPAHRPAPPRPRSARRTARWAEQALRPKTGPGQGGWPAA